MYNILHVDPNPLLQRLLRNILSSNEINYINVNKPSDAFYCLEEKQFDLIITAMELDEENGKDFILNLNNSEFSNIPVVVTTSNDSIELRKELFQLGVIDYISKDALIEEKLKNCIEKLSYEDTLNEKMKSLRVAIVDDSKLEQRIVSHILQANSITHFDIYSSGKELLDSNKNYDLYITDLVLPGISGEELIFKIREHDEKAIIIAFSVIDNYKTIANILLYGANDYILKPFDASIFIARIKANARTFFLTRELEIKNAVLKEITFRDFLTGLYNNKYLFDRLKQETEASIRYNRPLSIIMFDIDHFKDINDNYGHLMGDEVLRQVSDIMRNHFRKVDIVGRYGGEEFLAILPETRLDMAKIAAEKVRTAIENLKIKDLDKKITISGGIAEYAGQTEKEFINVADKLLYKAKHSGRNQVHPK